MSGASSIKQSPKRRSQKTKQSAAKERSHLWLIVSLVVLLCAILASTLIYTNYKKRCASCASPIPRSTGSKSSRLPAKLLHWGGIELDGSSSRSVLISRMETEAQRLLTEAKPSYRLAEKDYPLPLPLPLKLDLDRNLEEIQAASAQSNLKVIWIVSEQFDAWRDNFLRALQATEEGSALSEDALSGLGAYLTTFDWQLPFEPQLAGAGAIQDPAFNGLHLVSEAVTPNLSGDPARAQNLARAALLLNGRSIAPGASLSYNTTIGPITIENGYAAAGIQADGATAQGVGGGLCQPSTTLFQAAVLAGGLDFPIKNNHSIPVNYCPLGQDAMISGWSDLVIRNLTNEPYKIQAVFDGAQFLVRFYGPALPEGESLQMAVEHLGMIEPEEADVYRYNAEVPAGELKTVRARQQGQRTRLYRQHIRNGEVVQSDDLGVNYYEPFNGIFEYSDEAIRESLVAEGLIAGAEPEPASESSDSQEAAEASSATEVSTSGN